MSKKWIETAMAVFREACELPAHERDAFLDHACGGDTDIRRHVDAMLACDDDTDPALADAKAPLPVRSALADLVRSAESAPGTDGAVLPEIDGYRIVRLIAHGGMGTVYEGEQEHPSRRVAIKIAQTDGTSAERAQRFELEAQLLARLRHPRIAQIIEAGTTSPEHGSRPFFVMEFVAGQRLTDYAETRLQTARDKLELMVAICDALGFAHDRGVIHRDLKPDNVLIEAGGTPKVLDFGVAKVEEAGGFGASTMLTEVGRVIGTMGYMSPEQLGGTSEGLGPESDVYSLGVMIYELLTGRRPHELSAITLTQALAIVSNTDAPLLGVVRPEFRGDLEAIVAKALEKAPRHRYADGAALQRDLELYLRGEPVLARPAGPLRRLSKWSRRNPALSTAVFAAFLLLTTGLLITMMMLKQVDDARAGTQDSLAGAFLEKAERALSDHDFGAAAVFAAAAIENNPDNENGAHYRGREQSTASETRSARMSSVQFDSVAGRHFEFEDDLRPPADPPSSMNTWVHNLDFHPDDKRLATLVGHNRKWYIAVWSLAPEDPPIMLPAGPQPSGSQFGTAHWSPDGERLAAVRGDGIRIWRTADADYEPEPAFENRPDGPWQCVAFHPDSRHVALANTKGRIEIWSVLRRELVAGWSFDDQIKSIRFSSTGRLAVAGRNRVQLIDVDIEHRQHTAHPSQPLTRAVAGALAFSTDGSLFATTSFGRLLQLWSGIDGRPMGQMQPKAIATSLAFLDESRFIYSGLDGRGALIEAREPGQPSHCTFERELLVVDTMHFPGVQHSNVAISRTQDPKDPAAITIATQGKGPPRLHTLRHAKLPYSKLRNHTGPLNAGFAAAWTRDNRQLVDTAPESEWTLAHYTEIPGGDLRQALRRDVPFDSGIAGRELFDRAGDGFMGSLISPDERWLIVGTWSRGAVMFAFPSLDNARVLSGPQQDPNMSYPSAAVAFTPDKPCSALFLAKRDGTILRWSLTGSRVAPEPQIIRKGGKSEVLSLMVSPDKRWLAAGDRAGRVWLFDLNNGNAPIELLKRGRKPHGNLALSVDFSRDSQWLVSAGQTRPNNILQWHVETQELTHELKGHDAWPMQVRYALDGKRIFSSSTDSTNRIWSRLDGRQLHVFHGEGGIKVEHDDWFSSFEGRRIIRRQIKASNRSDGAMESLKEAEAAIGMKLQGLRLQAWRPPQR